MLRSVIWPTFRGPMTIPGAILLERRFWLVRLGLVHRKYCLDSNDWFAVESVAGATDDRPMAWWLAQRAGTVLGYHSPAYWPTTSGSKTTNSGCRASAMMRWNYLAFHFAATGWSEAGAHRRNHRSDWHAAIGGSMVVANQQSLESMTVSANRTCLMASAGRTSSTNFGMDCAGDLAFAAINHTNKRLHIFAVWLPVWGRWKRENLIRELNMVLIEGFLVINSFTFCRLFQFQTHLTFTSIFSATPSDVCLRTQDTEECKHTHQQKALRKRDSPSYPLNNKSGEQLSPLSYGGAARNFILCSHIRECSA